MRATILLFILMSAKSFALDMCPVGSRFLSFKGESSAPEVLLCESTNPHEYFLMFPDGRKRHYPIIPVENNKNIVEQLKMLNWDPVRLSHVKSVHAKNVENENRYYEMRENYRSISILDMINNNAGSIGSLVNDPCRLRLDAPTPEGEDWKHIRKYVCEVEISKSQKARLGITESGRMSLKRLETLMRGAKFRLNSKTSVASSLSSEPFRPKDFAEYELRVTTSDSAEPIYLDGTCREQRDISMYYESFGESDRRPKEDTFVNPLDFKVNLAGMDVGFPVDVQMNPTGTQNRDGDDQYDVDLNLGVSTDLHLGGGVMMNVAPTVQVPFARNVSGISDFGVNNLTRDLMPKEVGVKFSLEF